MIVGNGPSLYEAGLGCEIDNYENVVRMHNWSTERPEDFGRKYTHGVLPGAWLRRADKQIKDVPSEAWLCYSFGKHRPVKIEGAYRGKEVHLYEQEIDDFFVETIKEGLSPTRGIAAVYMAAASFRPKQITLAGFDSVLSGKVLQYHEKHHEHYEPHLIGETKNERHDFEYEKRMLKAISQKFNVKIRSI